MKKTIYILLALFFISVNIFSYDYIFNKQIFDTLFSEKTELNITYHQLEPESAVKTENLLEKMVEFSKVEQVNITQYNFFDKETLNIYSTNIEDDSTVHLKSGKFPNGTQYISNTTEVNEENQIGTIAFPLSTWKVKYFDINQVNNVGLGNKFYINTMDTEILEKAVKQFSPFGEVSFEVGNNNHFFFFNTTLLLLLLLSFVVLSICMFFFIIKNRKQQLLQKLWGYSKMKSLLSVPEMFLKPFIFIVLFVGILLVILAFSYGQTYWLISYILIYLLNVFFSALILIVYTLSISLVLHKFTISGSNVKGKLPIKRFQWLSLGFKLIITLILFNIITLSLTNFLDLKQQLDNKSYWTKTQEVFSLNFAPTGINYDDLNIDREINDNVNKLYQELEKHKNAFIMHANNYLVIGRNGREPIYNYTMNTTQENEVYSVAGRSVSISENYLKVNPIVDVNGQNVINQFNNDSNTLNILVPEQYAIYEEKIVESYKKEFFFQKVEVDNIYNKEINKPLNMTKKDRLHINIIYTQKGQEYFTFNSNMGDINNQNNIIDPIAVLYNGNVDTSFIGAYATTSLFYFDDSKGNAYQNIIPYLEETNTKNLISASTSTYQELSDEILQLQWLLIKYTISLFITLILSVAFLSSYTWTYYSANTLKLNLKYLFGFSYWDRNKHLLILSFTANSMLGLVISFYYRVYELMYFIILFIGIELVIVYLLSNYLNQKNINKILKGDKI